MFLLETGKVAVLKSWRGQDYLLPNSEGGRLLGEMAVMDLLPRSASIRAVEDCTAIRLSVASLYQVYEHDLKQFALIQMNMGRK
jgi:CRP-like cAMP-binding protein